MNLFVLIANPRDVYDECEVYSVCTSKEKAQEFGNKRAKEDLDAKYEVVEFVSAPIYLRGGLFFTISSFNKTKAAVVFARKVKRVSFEGSHVRSDTYSRMIRLNQFYSDTLGTV